MSGGAKAGVLTSVHRPVSAGLPAKDKRGLSPCLATPTLNYTLPGELIAASCGHSFSPYSVCLFVCLR